VIQLEFHQGLADIRQENLANAKVNARQHCVVWSHWNSGNAIWRGVRQCSML